MLKYKRSNVLLKFKNDIKINFSNLQVYNKRWILIANNDGTINS